jgi:hypothetical protein
VKISLSAAALLWVFPLLAPAQVAILHIQVIEGEGTVNLPGARNSHPLAVEVTDETGKPVEGASVSFHLPEEGPAGTFGNGLRTDVIVTDAHGRAAVRSLQLNRTPGRIEIRIVASKEQARAGTVSFQYIAEGKTATRSSAVSKSASKSSPKASRHTLRWAALAILAGGAAAAGVVLSGKSSGTSSAGPTSSATPTSPAGFSIGSPTLTVGKP